MVKKYWDVGVAVFRFLKAARNRVKDGMSKEQILDFARREFGEVSKLLRKQIDDLFKKKPTTTKKGDVVPIKEGEGIVATKKATDIAKKRTEDIAKGDVTGETGDLMNKIEADLESLKKANKKLQETTEGLTDSPFDDFYNYVLGGHKAIDPKQGMVRTAAREILEKNKIRLVEKIQLKYLEKHMVKMH